MPGPVRVRVAALIALGALATALPWLLPVREAWAAGLQLALVLVGLYVGWCLWPRWLLLVPAALRFELPVIPGQPFRLSFDDGPTGGLTGAILDLLREHGVRASFFVLSHKARAHPALVRRIVAEGHLLGLHGADHRQPFGRGAAELHAALERGRRELEAVAGVAVTAYRPSHGRKTLALLRAVRRAGLRLCVWDHGVWDTDAPPAQVLLRRLRAAAPGAPAALRRPPVLLLHDGRDDAPAVPAHAAPLLEALRLWLAEQAPRCSDAP